jgi:hypothetical protein
MGMFRIYPVDFDNTGGRSWYREPKEQTPEPVKSAVEDYAWQMFRGCRLKGQPTEEKLSLLLSWLHCWEGTPYEQLAKVQIGNYLGALKRSGFIREQTMRPAMVAPQGHFFPGASHVWWDVVK